jgi:hypothetical protein
VDLDLDVIVARCARTDLVAHNVEIVGLEPLLHKSVRSGDMNALSLDLPERERAQPEIKGLGP